MTKGKADHLTSHQFQPGQSGNPAGRPVGYKLLTGRLRKILAENDGQLAESLMKAALRDALRGKSSQLQQIWDRIDGSVPTRIQHEEVADRMLAVAREVLDEDSFARYVEALAMAGDSDSG